MGATDFIHYGTGRTVHEAFHEARQEALYEFGHGGYTGTIAEKYDVFEVTVPPRVKAHKVYETAWHALDTLYDPMSGQLRKENKYTKARAQLVAWFGEAIAQRILECIDDKWGPCVALKLSRTENFAFVPRTPTGKRKKNYEAWMFFGMAAS